MARQIVITKKRRGPKPTGIGTLIGVRMQPDQLAAIDSWISAQFVPYTRPDAIRVLVDLGLNFRPQPPVDKRPKRRR